MFTRPPFPVVAATVASLALAVVLTIAPFDFWWERIDPIGSSFSHLATANVFYIGVHDEEGAVPTEIRAWRTIARARRADSLFAELLERASPAGRVYAVLGLQHLGSRRLQVRSPALTADTAPVAIWVPCRTGTRVPFNEILSFPELAAWRQFLASWSPDSANGFECVPPNQRVQLSGAAK